MSEYAIALRLATKPRIMTPGGEADLALPKGCVGILYAFESAEAARAVYGDDQEVAMCRESLARGAK